MIDYMTSNLRLDCLKLAVNNSDYSKPSAKKIIEEASDYYNFVIHRIKDSKESPEETKIPNPLGGTFDPKCKKETTPSSWEIFTKSLDECFKNAPKEIQPFINPFNYK